MIARRSAVSMSACSLLLLSLPALALSQPKATSPRVAPAQKRVAIADQKATKNVVSPQGFSVVLVLGDLQASGGEDDVPPAARKALADMRDFLPYKSYKLLDAAWILCCAGSRVVNRLRGPDERDYELEISSSPVENARTYVRFALRDSADALTINGKSFDVAGYDAGAAGIQLRQRQADVERMRAGAAETERQLRDLRRKSEAARTPDERAQLSDQIAALQARLQAANREIASLEVERRTVTTGARPRALRSLIDTSFTMDVGETVVVGTSRLSGGPKALIALLTAVPPRSQRR